MPDNRPAGHDRLLVIEVLLAIALFGLAVGFFLIPAGAPGFLPDWWVGFLLAILFFAIIVLETFRRHARSRDELRRVMRRPPPSSGVDPQRPDTDARDEPPPPRRP